MKDPDLDLLFIQRGSVFLKRVKYRFTHLRSCHEIAGRRSTILSCILVSDANRTREHRRTRPRPTLDGPSYKGEANLGRDVATATQRLFCAFAAGWHGPRRDLLDAFESYRQALLPSDGSFNHLERPISAPQNHAFTAYDSGRFLEHSCSARQAVPTPMPSCSETTRHEAPAARGVATCSGFTLVRGPLVSVKLSRDRYLSDSPHPRHLVVSSRQQSPACCGYRSQVNPDRLSPLRVYFAFRLVLGFIQQPRNLQPF